MLHTLAYLVYLLISHNCKKQKLRIEIFFLLAESSQEIKRKSSSHKGRRLFFQRKLISLKRPSHKAVVVVVSESLKKRPGRKKNKDNQRNETETIPGERGIGQHFEESTFELFFCSFKDELPHPVSACVFRIALRFRHCVAFSK